VSSLAPLILPCMVLLTIAWAILSLSLPTSMSTALRSSEPPSPGSGFMHVLPRGLPPWLPGPLSGGPGLPHRLHASVVGDPGLPPPRPRPVAGDPGLPLFVLLVLRPVLLLVLPCFVSSCFELPIIPPIAATTPRLLAPAKGNIRPARGDCQRTDFSEAYSLPPD
jgi:hypothetical protein